MTSLSHLLKKYDVPTPRYTSYPTVPCWDTSRFDRAQWLLTVKRSFDESNDTEGISLYIHLPFCESLCTYCACNTRITRNHGVEVDYIRALLKEWESYRLVFARKPVIRELHLGGGTPTFFSPRNLKWLISYLLEDTIIHPEHEFSIEGHPNNTSVEHLQTLFDLGFRRVSYGVQDLDEKVQRTINRVQPFENLERVTRASRAIGFTSVSFDLIYGLPFQTVETVTDTMTKVLGLKPDRIAFYSYAHVPWLRPGQRGYGDADLPTDVIKRKLYETGRGLLKSEGYEDIGMDHFSLPTDSLFAARRSGKLHRNFMGYTTNATRLLIGLGTSAISDSGYAYAQNEKKVESYRECVKESGFAITKGHLQTEEDLVLKQLILGIACQGTIPVADIPAEYFEQITAGLDRMCDERILSKSASSYDVGDDGRAFIRNVCALFDRRMQHAISSADSPVFSRAI